MVAFPPPFPPSLHFPSARQLNPPSLPPSLPPSRSIPNFREVYTYIREKLEDDAKANTAVLPELK